MYLNLAGFVGALILGMLASSGLWSVILYKIQRKDKEAQISKEDFKHLSKLMLGLGHEKIIELGIKYIERGSVTKDEYEDLIHYLYKPYLELGGNGTVEKIMTEVKKLPIH